MSVPSGRCLPHVSKETSRDSIKYFIKVKVKSDLKRNAASLYRPSELVVVRALPIRRDLPREDQV